MQTVLKSGRLKHLEPSGPVQSTTGIALPLPLPYGYILSTYKFLGYFKYNCIYLLQNIQFVRGKVIRISGQPFPVKIMIDQKQLENVESFKYLGSIPLGD